MTNNELFQQIRSKKSFLCVGLDTDLSKIPSQLLNEKDPVFEFNKLIIDATHDLCVAYKPNIAFYESLGAKGWESLEKTLEYIPDHLFTIADAKRGDIGNTANLYATTFFDTYSFDSVTVAPYMGKDSVTPFLNHEGKWAIVLALTSNEGANDFQMLDAGNDHQLFEEVLLRSKSWGSEQNMMYVVGATRGELIRKVRSIVPDHFLLVPGVGAQGGSLEEVARYGLNDQCGLLVNSSRGIIYAGSAVDFDVQARHAARSVQQDMEHLLRERGLVD